MRATRSSSTFLLLALLSSMPAAPAAAQEDERPATLLYEAYYKVNFGDMEDWNRQYEAYARPVLEALQAEGVIEGWGHWQHNVGSEYNVRMGIRLYDWASIETFWDEYLRRTNESMSADEAALASRMIEAHRDEVWDLDTVRFGDNAGSNNHMYASTFNVNFDDVEEWDRIWNERVLPILGESMETGVLNGVVLLNHNTGGAHNKKVLYMFETWDTMDDMWNHFFQRMEEVAPEDMATMFALVQAHDDVIWSSAPPPDE